jgi:glycosyltransferase involved in cell wall biosynthesis
LHDQEMRASTAPAAAALASPSLTVCIPTYQRPDMFRRALSSVVDAGPALAHDVEIIVGDNSPDVSESVYRDVISRWTGRQRYIANRPSLPAIENFNHLMAQAAGQFVLLLHDDDYLLPGGLSRILDGIAESDGKQVLLFGVDVVDRDGRVRRRQAFRRRQWLSPSAALTRLLGESSFVRIPGIVVHRDALDGGPFDPNLANPTDFDLHIRLFARHGVMCVPQVTAAYTVHAEAATSTMFNPTTIESLMRIFERAVATGVLPQSRVRRLQVDWFHQFLLGGAFRHLQIGDRAGAEAILSLFDLPSVAALGRSRRWLPVRLASNVLVRAPSRLTSLLVRAATRFGTMIWLSW